MMTTRSHPRLSLAPLALMGVIGLVGGLLLTGCGGQSRDTASQTTPPSVFGLSLTVIQDNPDEPNPLNQAARYVLETDGWLRAGTGPGATRDTLPPRVRRLTRTQRQMLWDFTRKSGLLDEDNPVRIASGDGPIPDGARPLLLITARTDRGRSAGAVALESALGEPYGPILARLCEWAWIAPVSQ